MKSSSLIIAAAVIILVGVPLRAHHSFGGLRAPHSFLYVEVADPDGTTKQWVIEGATAAQFARQGIDKDAFRIGDPVEVVVNPSRSPNSTHGRLIQITRTTDGKSWGSKAGEAVN